MKFKKIRRSKRLEKLHAGKIVVAKSSATIAGCVDDSEIGDSHHQIAMAINDITCFQCITVIEAVLGGCEGSKPPIDGILDAVADFHTSMVLIRINNVQDAEPIAAKAKQYLAMLGYVAEAKRMSCTGASAHSENEDGSIEFIDYTKDAVVVEMSRENCFKWNVPCICHNRGVAERCARHNQIKQMDWEVFSP